MIWLEKNGKKKEEKEKGYTFLLEDLEKLWIYATITCEKEKKKIG